MPRDETPPADAIDAELEALDGKDQALLDKLNRFAVLQAQYEAQRKEIESQRRQLEREKQKRLMEEAAASREAERLEREKREKERQEREREEAKERERREKEAERLRKEEEKRDSGRRLSVRSATRTPGRSSNNHQEKENWDLMSGNDVCTRCKERGEDCYRPAKSISANIPRPILSLSTPAKLGSGQIALEKGMRCRGCRESRKKCSTDTIEPGTPSSASRTETPSSQNAKKRKSTTDEAEEGRAKKARTSFQMENNPRQLSEGVLTLSDTTMGELETLFTDLVKHQEITLSIQRQILRTISSSRPPKVFEPYEKEETDELLLGSDMGYEPEYTDGK
jgi:multidrug efflux pump subunit AcrA (membrane-fusion protein)